MKMKQIKMPVVTMLLALLFSACASVNASPDMLKDEIVAANKAFMTIFERGDSISMANLYTDDGSLMPTNSDFVNGKEGIAAVWQSVFDAGLKQATLETLEVEGLGNTAYEVGKYTLFLDGGKVADSGKYIVIWKKKDGQWKLYRDIFNTSVPLEK